MEICCRRLEITGDSGGQGGPEDHPRSISLRVDVTCDVVVEEFENIGLPLLDAQIHRFVAIPPGTDR
jgi:hypothetical protein